MIVGSYTLHLYCDADDSNCHATPYFGFAYTAAEKGSKARTNARFDGWFLDVHTGRALCPCHNPRASQELKDAWVQFRAKRRHEDMCR